VCKEDDLPAPLITELCRPDRSGGHSSVSGPS
jgi:hypothetical protein